MIDIPNYDEWKLSCGLEDEKVIGTCDSCGREIYYGESYYIYDGEDSIHEDCLLDYIKNSPFLEKVVAE